MTLTKGMIASISTFPIFRILLVITSIQMIRIYAKRIIASMQNKLASWDFSFCRFVSKTMGKNPIVIAYSKLAISKFVGCRRPNMTIHERYTLNFCVKSFLNSCHNLHRLRGCAWHLHTRYCWRCCQCLTFRRCATRLRKCL